MPQSPETQSIIEKAVAEVLDKALPRLRAEIVRHTSEQLQALAPFSGPSSSELLNVATASIQEASSQAEILRQLLEGSARFAGRAALFVARGGAMSGWQGIGFDNDFLKGVSLNGASGLAAQAMQSRVPASGRASEFDAAFLASAGKPADDHCLVLPLVVKDKVAALVYADPGTSGGSLDGSALSVLTRCASLWLELVALRKADGVPAEEPQAATASAAFMAAPPAFMPSPPAAPPAAGGDTELHRKAKRFAKLLVEEIKLYNQPKVTEGRLQRDLYERLKEDIEKSRATYDKRYGESPVASANYFTEELIRILADNDVTLMGASFPR
jgi:hypothetical protein